MVTVSLSPEEVLAVLKYLGPAIDRAKLTEMAPLFRAHYKLDNALLAHEEKVARPC